MENSKNLFDLNLDVIAKNHLKGAAKWARFLAIVGFIALGLLIIISIVIAVNTKNGTDEYGVEVSKNDELVGTIIASLLMFGIYFFPCYFMLRFGNKMNAALVSDDINALNEAFKNLKITLRYFGVATIIFLVFLALGLVTELTDS